MTFVDVVVAFLILSGVALALLGAAGLQQFNDVFARMHAATKPVTLGLPLIAIGAALHLGEAGAAAKLGLVVVLQFITAPIAAHMIGRAAYWTGTELAPETIVDELAEADLTPAAMPTSFDRLGRRIVRSGPLPARGGARPAGSQPADHTAASPPPEGG